MEKKVKVQRWLKKAESDLSAARLLARTEDQILDYAVVHCQQAAEKAIKAFLVFHDRAWDNKKGHNLRYLISLAVEFDSNINSRVDERSLLTEYAINPRYPDFRIVTLPEFERALKNAEEFHKYILQFLQLQYDPPDKTII